MTKLTQWIATIVAALLLLLLLVLEVSDSASKIKPLLWVLGVLVLAAAVAFDLWRQRKLRLPGDVNP
jgi:hypothetical protein